MKVQSTIYYIVAITLIIIAVLCYINYKVKRYDPLSKPTGVVLLMMMAVQMVDGMVNRDTNEEIGKNLGPYIGSIFIYILFSNICGLIGFETPTSNLSVTLALAAITVVLVEKNSIKYNGIKSYVHGLFEPFAPFVLMNLISKISPLISLSMRLFGNILAGGIIMTLLYSATAMLSSLIPFIGQFNIFGVLIAPALHFYFDLFAGALQAYIFISLTIAFIGKELPVK